MQTKDSWFSLILDNSHCQRLTPANRCQVKDMSPVPSRWRSSFSKGAKSLSVGTEPSRSSLRLARVTATFRRLQSFSSSPVWGGTGVIHMLGVTGPGTLGHSSGSHSCWGTNTETHMICLPFPRLGALTPNAGERRNTHATLGVAPNEGDNDDILVPALVLVHCVDLDSTEGRAAQQAWDGSQLLPVWGNNADVLSAAARLQGTMSH